MDRSLMHLKSALLAMEPASSILYLARQFGRGSITTELQTFILEHCLNHDVDGHNARCDMYMKNILKSIILAAESSNDDVLEGLYEQFVSYMSLNLVNLGLAKSPFEDSSLLILIGNFFTEDDSPKENNKIYKHISFYNSDGHDEIIDSVNLVVTLQCSLNMLEGDTGCTLWPSSLLLSEFILSHPGIFTNTSCLEVGSGVGLVGICLAYVGTSKVILTDGDVSTLANMEQNLKLNQLTTKNKIECKHLPWETASETELQSYQANILLGADIVYDPCSVPHLIRVLSVLLNSSKPNLPKEKMCRHQNSGNHRKEGRDDDMLNYEAKEAPVAYIATVIRNSETLNYFLRLASEANISVEDITDVNKSLNLLPYMLSYDRASVHLYKLSSVCN